MGNVANKGITVHQRKIGRDGKIHDIPIVVRPSMTKALDVMNRDDMRVVSCGVKGWRESMEDAIAVRTSMPIHDDVVAVAVFDGHGGTESSLWCARCLLDIIAGTEAWAERDFEKACADGFVQADLEMRAQKVKAGCTAVVALVMPGKIVVADAGDSRAVLGRLGKAEALSDDHKPDHPIERKRVVDNGGSVIKIGGICRLTTPGCSAMLAVSRSLGDFEFKQEGVPPEKQVVTALPDVRTVDRSETDDFLVLACDGIWDVMSSQDVITYFQRADQEALEMSASRRDSTMLQIQKPDLKNARYGPNEGAPSKLDKKLDATTAAPYVTAMGDEESKEPPAPMRNSGGHSSTGSGRRQSFWSVPAPTLSVFQGLHILPAHHQHSLKQVAGSLLQTCLKKGSKDNMSVLVVDLRGISPDGFVRRGPVLSGLTAGTEAMRSDATTTSV